MYEKSSAAQSGAAGRDSMTLAGGDDHLNAYAGNDVEKRTSKQDRKSGLICSGSTGAADIEERAVGAEGDFNYHSLEWWQAGMLMVAEIISLGILSLPSTFSQVGIVGGTIMTLGLGALATYTGWTIGKFKLRYPHVQNQADAGEIIGGPWLREAWGIAQILFLIFVCGSHVLTGTIALQTIAANGTCTVVWSVVIAVVSLILTLPRTYSKLSYFSIVSFISIFAAVMLTMIGVGIQSEGITASARAREGTTFASGFTAATNIIFAYAGHVAFFGFIDEMRKPADYMKSLALLQGTDMVLYLVVGLVVALYVGDQAVSPALGNLSPTLARIAYGIAIPTIVIAGVINGAVAAKLAMQRLFPKDSPHIKNSTKLGWTVWVAIVSSIWILAFVIANVVPFFNQLNGIISALFVSLFTYAVAPIYYMHLNPRATWFASKRQSAITVLNFFVILMSLLILGGGLYASAKGIADGYSSGAYGSPFSCTRPT